MKPFRPRKDRRMEDRFIIIERRKGKIWMYSEIILFAGLSLYLMRLLA